MAGMIHGTRLEVGADAKKTIEILNKEFESTPCMKGAVHKEARSSMGIIYEEKWWKEPDNYNPRSAVSENYLSRKLKDGAQAMPGKALEGGLGQGVKYASAALGQAAGVGVHAVQVGGIALALNPATIAGAVVIKVAVSSATAVATKIDIQHKLAWYNERWNTRSTDWFDNTAVGNDSIKCDIIDKDNIEWVANPMHGNLLVDALNEAGKGMRNAKNIQHNAIVDTVFAFACHRLVEKHEKSVAESHVYGQLTNPVARLGNAVLKKVGLKEHTGDIQAAAELITRHLMVCNCRFTLELLRMIVGQRDFEYSLGSQKPKVMIKLVEKNLRG